MTCDWFSQFLQRRHQFGGSKMVCSKTAIATKTTRFKRSISRYAQVSNSNVYKHI